jgi:hypothetical protein
LVKSPEVPVSALTEIRRRSRLSLNMFLKCNTCLQVKGYPIMPRRSKVENQNKVHVSTTIPPSYVLRRNNLGKVVATYVGNRSNIYVKTSLWVPKILVANVECPNSSWGPKRRN